ILLALHRSLVKPLEPSSCAAERLGPKALMPAAVRSSTMPAQSGASGPTTTRSIFCALQNAITAAWSAMSSATNSHSRAMPALPGAHTRRPTSGLAASFHASACSRPPEPRRRMFMAAPPSRWTRFSAAGVACSDCIARDRRQHGARSMARWPRGLLPCGNRCYEPHAKGFRQRGIAAMEIKPAGSVPTRRGPADSFTGTVWQDPIIEAPAPARIRGAFVRFEPRARTAWHTHPLGQTLHVVSGVGRVALWGGPVREIRAGDTVWIAPGEKHWHGASPDTAMMHIALQEHLDGKHVAWLEHVTDEQYNAKVGG